MQPAIVNDRVDNIKNDQREINRFVEEYRPFIAACAEKVSGRYVRYGEDDELSIALMAFVEAVKQFDSGKGSFLSFARHVIRKRLIDYFRKESRYFNVISLNEYVKDSDEESDLTEEAALERYSAEEISEYRRMELRELKRELAAWQISFTDLADTSPKHDSTKKMCREIVAYITSRQELVKTIRCKKYLPVMIIEKAMGIPRKKIERVRKYIIAAVLISTGDYQYIREYIK